MQSGMKHGGHITGSFFGNAHNSGMLDSRKFKTESLNGFRLQISLLIMKKKHGRQRMHIGKSTLPIDGHLRKIKTAWLENGISKQFYSAVFYQKSYIELGEVLNHKQLLNHTRYC